MSRFRNRMNRKNKLRKTRIINSIAKRENGNREIIYQLKCKRKTSRSIDANEIAIERQRRLNELANIKLKTVGRSNQERLGIVILDIKIKDG